MNESIWIVICGQVRNLFELSYTLHIALAARRRGTIQGVALSTWFGERENAPALLKAAENDGVFIVESPMPPEWEQQPPYRTTPLYQMLLLQRALEVVPDDAYVLKTRTDLIPDAALDFLGMLEYPERSIGRDALLSKERITVLHINNVLFFDIGDTQFFAHRTKMTGLLDFSVFVDAAANQYPAYFVPETRIFGQKYLRSSRHLSFLTSIIDVGKFMDVPILTLDNDELRYPKIIIGAYAVYYAALLKDFQLAWQGEATQGELRFQDLFKPHGPLCEELYRSGCAAIRADAKLRSRVLATPNAKDPNAVRFSTLLNGRMESAFDDHIGQQDVEELIAFNDAFPEQRRFLALAANAIWARVPQQVQRREFNLCDTLELRQHRGGTVFVRGVEEGQRIAHAAYQAYEAAVQLAPDQPVEATFWLELAAHYGHEPAQDKVNMPRLGFAELRQRRELWLKRTFPNV